MSELSLTTEMAVDALPLDRLKYNRERMIWEASVGAGFSTDLDASIIHARLLEMSAACLACADYVKPFIKEEVL